MRYVGALAVLTYLVTMGLTVPVWAQMAPPDALRSSRYERPAEPPRAFRSGTELVALSARYAGGYGNGFSAVPENWTVTGEGFSAICKRRDFSPQRYAKHVEKWIASGATIVGGCCEVGPAHIAKLHEMLKVAA